MKKFSSIFIVVLAAFLANAQPAKTTFTEVTSQIDAGGDFYLCYTVGNGSQSYAAVAILPAIAVPGILAAIAIPNFVKARETAQENACINNLRQIDTAKNQWALEHNKKNGDVPTEDDLKPYIRLVNGHLPTCPQGCGLLGATILSSGSEPWLGKPTTRNGTLKKFSRH